MFTWITSNTCSAFVQLSRWRTIFRVVELCAVRKDSGLNCLLNALRDGRQLSAFGSLKKQKKHGVRGCKHDFAADVSSCLRNTNIYKRFYAPKPQRKTTRGDALLRKRWNIQPLYLVSYCPTVLSRVFFKQSQDIFKDRLKFEKHFPGRDPTDSISS